MKIETLVGTVIGVAIGALIGGSAGYFVSEAKFRKQLETEYAKWKTSNEPVIAGSKEKPVEEKKEEPDVPTKEEVNEYRDRSSIYADPNQKKEPRVNYTAYSEPSKAKSNDPAENLAPVEHGDRPYQISFEEYNNSVEYEAKILTWYSESHVLIEDDTDEEKDPNETVGMENISELSKLGRMFVKNEALAEVYEVVYQDGLFEYAY